MAVEDFLIDSRYYRGGSLILAFCNDSESLKGLLVYGRSREEIEAKLRGAIVEILIAGGEGRFRQSRALSRNSAGRFRSRRILWQC